MIEMMMMHGRMDWTDDEHTWTGLVIRVQICKCAWMLVGKFMDAMMMILEGFLYEVVIAVHFFLHFLSSIGKFKNFSLKTYLIKIITFDF
jgi:hypothetical protein